MKLIDFDREELLAQAYGRVVDRRDIKRVSQGGPSARDHLMDCLDAALGCVRTLGNPAAAVIEVDAGEVVRELQHGDAPLLLTPQTEQLIASDSKAYLYLVTCGYDSREAMRSLENDYAAYHFQDEIAREIVFALARHTHRSVCHDHPGHRFVRHAIRTEAAASHGAPDQRTVRLWDPRRIGQLLQWFGTSTLGVASTSKGGLMPLHSLLGLMTGRSLDDAMNDSGVGKVGIEAERAY